MTTFSMTNVPGNQNCCMSQVWSESFLELKEEKKDIKNMSLKFVFLI